MDDKTLDAFIERAARLSKSKSKRLTEADVRDIALEVGLSEQDLALAESEGEDHLERGREFMQRSRYGDAVAEFDEALALLPGRVQPRVELARARAHRFLTYGNPMDRDRAEELARECLEIDPGSDAAYDVLDLIEPDDTRLARVKGPDADLGNQGSANTPNTAVLFFAAALAVTLLVGGAAVAWLTASGAPDPSQSPPDSPVSAKPAIVNKVSSNQPASKSPPETSTTPSEERGMRALEVDVIDSTGNDLSVDVRSSEIRLSGDYFYRLKGLVLNEGDNEIEALKARVVFVDDNGQALKSESGRRILSSHEPILRPGGAHAFGLLLRGHDQAHGLQLEYEWAEAVATDGSYEASKPVELHREAGQESWELSLAARQVAWSERNFGDEGFFKATFEMTNDGGGPIRHLKVKAEFYNAAGERIDQSEKYVVASGDPPLLVGETRPFNVINMTPLDYDHYRLVVASIR